MARRTFILGQTAVTDLPLVPEFRLHLATHVTPLWQATEDSLHRTGLPPPYWAFPWVGGQAVARHVLDHPELVAGRRVLDFAAGCGLITLAAARAVWVLASGPGKQAALRHSLAATGTSPLAQVLQRRTATTIFTDIADF